MHHVLRPHPELHFSAATHIDVTCTRKPPNQLLLSYNVTGPIKDIRIPPIAAATRADNLWRHTCFEAFIGAPPDGAYYEFNFSPSTRWAAYRFSGYRKEMSVATEIDAVPIDTRADADHYMLQASLDLAQLPALPQNGALRLGLAAVIEDVGGNKSYWALAHPPGKPDFHHADCFAHGFFAGSRP
jgi:hypothetical protein